MRKYKTFIAIAIAVSALTFSLGSWTVGQVSEDSDIGLQSGNLAELTLSEMSQAPEVDISPMANGTINVFSYVSQDLNTNATIIFFTNTSDDPATVTLCKYYLDGNLLKNSWANFDLNPGIMVPLCSDEVVSPVGVWNYALHWNLGPYFAYGLVFVPPGVVLEGYVAWNGSDNKYNPGDLDDNVETVPIKFTYIGSISE